MADNETAVEPNAAEQQKEVSLPPLNGGGDADSSLGKSDSQKVTSESETVSAAPVEAGDTMDTSDTVTNGIENTSVSPVEATPMDVDTPSKSDDKEAAAMNDDQDTVAVGDGQDTVAVGDGQNTVAVGDGQDTVAVGDGQDTVAVGDGQDTVAVGDGQDTVAVGDGQDTVAVGDGQDTVGDGQDTVAVGDGQDTVAVGDGQDTVAAGDGQDTVAVGDGQDTVAVGDGQDTVAVGDGQDTVAVGDGQDTVAVGDGADTADVSDGVDTAAVGVGMDTDGPDAETVIDGPDTDAKSDGPEVSSKVDSDSAVTADDSQSEVMQQETSRDTSEPTDSSLPVITNIVGNADSLESDEASKGTKEAEATDKEADQDDVAVVESDDEGAYQTDLPDEDAATPKKSDAEGSEKPTSSAQEKEDSAAAKTKSSDAQPEKSTTVNGQATTERKKSADGSAPAAPSQASDANKDKKTQQGCIVCEKVGKCKYNIMRNGDVKHLCDDTCFKVFRAQPTAFLKSSKDSSKDGSGRRCHGCRNVIPSVTSMVMAKQGGTTVFYCGKECQKKHDNKGDDDDVMITGTSKTSTTAKSPTPAAAKPAASTPAEGTPTTPMRRTRAASGLATCAACHKMSSVKHEVSFEGRIHKICSDTCFSAFRNENKLSLNMCEECGRYVYEEGCHPQTMQFEGSTKRFCGQACVATFKKSKARIVACAWCHIRKPNFDMVERLDVNHKVQLFCTLNCLSLFRVNLQATSNSSVSCDQCHKVSPAQYHLTMSDASVRNFCTYPCVMAFQAQFSNPNKQQQQQQQRNPTVATPNNQAIRNNNRQTNRVLAAAEISPGSPAPGVRAQRMGSPIVVASQQTPPQTQQTRGVVAKQGATLGTARPANQASIPIIASVMSLAQSQTSPQGNANQSNRPRRQTTGQQQASSPATPINVTPQTASTAAPTERQVIIQHPNPKQMKNRSLLCKPIVQTKATSCRPHTQSKETQTDEDIGKQVMVPIPIPIYVPVPLAMYNRPVPYPVPIPIPIPVPQFIPTTKKTTGKLIKYIKDIIEKTPSDPFEAEMLAMAEAVANAEKAQSDTSDEEDANQENMDPSQQNLNKGLDSDLYGMKPEATAPQNDGEDMLEMALRIAQEMRDEPQMDLEESIESTPINPPDSSYMKSALNDFNTIDSESGIVTEQRRRGRPRASARNKRIKVEEEGGTTAFPASSSPVQNSPQTTPATQPPDANMVLKFTYGVNAWKHWVVQKNAQLEQISAGKKLKKFKTDILQCSVEELNNSLCLFVKEVRKPNGEEYAPDSIYYLCLGIQQYLYENGRIDNIFTDLYFEKFTQGLHEVLLNYEVRLNAHGLIVCRIEEEHLWESKQLGAHSPCVLLNTLMYFNTKFFMLNTALEHQNLSFSHIMKHWKKTNVPGSKTPGRMVYLRYYAPAPESPSVSAGGKRKREESPIFEQGENSENPLRCPVKLYEFYLSKCPESIKNRNDVFYLTPERSCVPDSPVWYSTLSLAIEPLQKMLTRTEVVREIQEARLHQQPLYM